MGMFDTVRFARKCPVCGEDLPRGEWQTKDTACCLKEVEASDVSNFYTGCKCGAWLEYDRIPSPRWTFTVTPNDGETERYEVDSRDDGAPDPEEPPCP